MSSPLSINGNDIIAQNHSMFTVEMQLRGNEITFLNIKEGNQAPEIDTNEENELNKGIKISESENLKLNDSKNKKITSTNDNSNLYIYLLLMFISLMVIVVISFKKKILNKKI